MKQNQPQRKQIVVHEAEDNWEGMGNPSIVRHEKTHNTYSYMKEKSYCEKEKSVLNLKLDF